MHDDSDSGRGSAGRIDCGTPRRGQQQLERSQQPCRWRYRCTGQTVTWRCTGQSIHACAMPVDMRAMLSIWRRGPTLATPALLRGRVPPMMPGAAGIMMNAAFFQPNHHRGTPTRSAAPPASRCDQACAQLRACCVLCAVRCAWWPLDGSSCAACFRRGKVWPQVRSGCDSGGRMSASPAISTSWVHADSDHCVPGGGFRTFSSALKQRRGCSAEERQQRDPCPPPPGPCWTGRGPGVWLTGRGPFRRTRTST